MTVPLMWQLHMTGAHDSGGGVDGSGICIGMTTSIDVSSLRSQEVRFQCECSIFVYSYKYTTNIAPGMSQTVTYAKLLCSIFNGCGG